MLTSAMRSDEIATKAKHWFGLVSAVFDRRPVRLLKTDMMLRIFAGLATSHRAMELYWLGPTTAVFNGYAPKLLEEDIVEPSPSVEAGLTARKRIGSVV